MPPAARITDMHACPMVTPGIPPVPHVGGPVITGEPTVITAFMPQARITDKCTCVGPPDVIVKGSPTVLVGGLPAARIGDTTAHGGVITTGAPNVLIGEAGAASVPPAVPPVLSPVCKQLAQALTDNLTAQDMAQLSNAAYDDPNNDDGLPEGYRRATPKEVQALGLSDGTIDMTRRPDSDFRADVFVRQGSDGPDEYVIAFQGSTTGEDWQTNVTQGLGARGGRIDRYAREQTDNNLDYYNEAALIGRTASAMAPGRVSFAGHSLGGGLASNAAAASGSSAHTFNAAGLHENTLAEFAQDGADPANVQAYYLADDPLNKLQDNVGLAPQAFGTRHRMATVDQWTDADRAAGERAVNPDNWIPDRMERAAGERKAQQLRFHGMDEMMRSLTGQEAEIRTAQERNECP